MEEGFATEELSLLTMRSLVLTFGLGGNFEGLIFVFCSEQEDRKIRAKNKTLFLFKKLFNFFKK